MTNPHYTMLISHFWAQVWKPQEHSDRTSRESARLTLPYFINCSASPQRQPQWHSRCPVWHICTASAGLSLCLRTAKALSKPRKLQCNPQTLLLQYIKYPSMLQRIVSGSQLVGCNKRLVVRKSQERHGCFGSASLRHTSGLWPQWKRFVSTPS